MINTLLVNVFMMTDPLAKPLTKLPSMENAEKKVSKEKTYLKAARQHADQARTDMKHGIEAQETAEKTGNPNFVRIAHWHFERCTTKSVKAEKYFLAAQKSLASRKRREYCRLRSIEMNQMAARAHYLENMLFSENHLTIT